ncbi:receptor-like protein kinase HERK 1 [Zingiber officinale]|nr:receptor-like protein kinase HERK 1 [Zingiber officinale]XP_042431905.1 receptor-like protein kinase HERK 1 [Zingiber officinale]XP_042431912.1 receptor-like protein kinase HERK 1 [Zingiber officinale]
MAIRKIQVSILILAITVISCGHCSFTPTDHYLIDCGSLNDTTIGNRVFQADDSVSVSWTLKSSSNNLANISENMVPSYYGMEQLFQNARVFTEPASYTFQIRKHGRHFIRLYFFPFVYKNYNLTAASFSVLTQDITLLNDFRPPLNVIVKEFSLIISSDTLSLSFAPSTNMSIAFVNAIEIMSVPDNLTGNDATIIHPVRTSYQGLSGQALETIYRINMGNQSVWPDDDTLWRFWENDQKYLISKTLSQPFSYRGQISRNDGVSEEIAPDIVYATATELSDIAQTTLSYSVNITWQFNVDAKSSYFIRFHFCDIVSDAASSLLFNVYVNTWLADGNLDLSEITFRRLATAVFLDFVLEADDVSDILSIKVSPGNALHGDETPNAILNGLEIMKINGSASSGQTVGTPTGSNKNFKIILGSSLGAIAVIVIAVVLFFILRKKRPAKQYSKTWVPFSATGLTSHSTITGTSNGIPSMDGQNGNLGYRFSFIAVQEATNNFDENLVIGVGGFGKVYKAVLRDETKVAVKRGNPKSQQGLNEFRTEIELLSRLRHRHLVSLIGYCDEKNEMILVYEYMENGTLKSHLYGSGLPSLSWKQRLEICIGAARGLHYLHTGQAMAVIHRDVKSANILLDENLLAKVADFGLSKTGPELDQTHVSTAVKGSFGYLDPEYYRRQQLTEKSDVYSFGVVLLEVLCARPVINPTLPREMVNLAEWGMKWQMKGELEQVADVRIARSIKPESLRKFGLTIEKCLADSGAERPSMGDVLWNLEYVLQLQEADGGDSEINSINRIPELAPQVGNIGTMENTPVVDDSTLLNDVTETSMSKVFSQLIKSEGR